MKYNPFDHLDEIITHLIKNLVWLPIAAIVPMIVAIGKNIIEIIKIPDGSFFTWTNVLILLSILILIALCLFLKISVVNKIQKQQEEIDKSKENALSSDFRAKSMEAELCFENREKITSRITYNMVALKNSITEIVRPITWTGSSYIGTTIEETNDDYTLIDSTRKISPHRIKILFNNEKNNGDFIKFTTVTSVEDGNHEMSPHYSFMVKYQIDELVLHVVAPPNLIKKVTKSVYADTAKVIQVEKPTAISKENVANLVRYTYKIKNPTFLYNYFIEWEFTN